MIKISAIDSESFTTIKNALAELDPTGDFLSYFKVAEQTDKDKTGITVILKNSKKFVKDLNRNKFVVVVPQSLIIDSYEFVNTFETVGRGRQPMANIVMKAHIANSTVNFVIILSGFNSPAIRVVRNDLTQSIITPSEDEEVTNNIDESSAVTDAIEDSIDSNIVDTDE